MSNPVRLDSDPYIDFTFYHTHDGFDWKGNVYFDTDDKTWSEPVYEKSPESDFDVAYEETSDEPPAELVEMIGKFIFENPYPKLAFRKKRSTNEEFIMELMQYSRFGALVQGFIMQALYEYSKQVAEADPKMFEPDKSEGLVLCIHGPSWQGVAKELFEKLEARFKE